MGGVRGGRKRIALGGIATESCTFSPLPTGLEHFRVREGAPLLDEADYPFLATTAAEVLPTLQARAIPGGTVAREAYEALKARFLARLEAALPLDGLYLDMHGAMNVEGMDDAEGDWYQAARAVVDSSRYSIEPPFAGVSSIRTGPTPGAYQRSTLKIRGATTFACWQLSTISMTCTASKVPAGTVTRASGVLR